MVARIRVLLVEDNNDDAELVYRELNRAGMEPALTCVDTLADLQQALAQSEWDLVISDYRLVGFNALNVIDAVAGAAKPAPLIMISGGVDDLSALAALSKGAVDFVPKDDLGKLPEAVERALGSLLDR